MHEQIQSDNHPVVIVGAGMAGLSCAVELHRANIPVRVIESSDGVGGRVRTDVVDGFRLDRGFQVYLDAYPETGKLLDLAALDLRKFEPGALVYKNGKLHRLMDVFRRPSAAISSALAPVGSLLDKLRVGRMRARILRTSADLLVQRKDTSTEQYLRDLGFSEAMIDTFFRSFYGGIFLENELRTSSHMFEFTFKMFGHGSATLPAHGMGEIPKQLASKLPDGVVQLNAEVDRIEPGRVHLSAGEAIASAAIVVATDATVAKRLVPDLDMPEPVWRSVTNLYFAAARSPITEPIICLNGSGKGLVNNVCFLTDAAPEYALDGRALVSVSVLGLPDSDSLPDAVTRELVNWFGKEVEDWQHLRTDSIKRALPEQLPVNDGYQKPAFATCDGIYICGDHQTSASIEGAVISGKRVAESIIAERRSDG